MPSSGEPTFVSRTLKALELAAQAPLGAIELANTLDVHPRTARRMLAALSASGYVEQVDGRKYIATMKVVGIAGRLLERTDLVRMSFPYVTRLRNMTGEAAHLSVPLHSSVMHLVQETGESVVMVKARIGEQVPYHSTAVGKALLAHLPDVVERLIADPLERFTEHTLVDPSDLLLDLSAVRTRGYAVDNLENDLDLRCIASPVFDHNGASVAALGISAPSTRLVTNVVAGSADRVVEVAQALSSAFGYQPALAFAESRDEDRR